MLCATESTFSGQHSANLAVFFCGSAGGGTWESISLQQDTVRGVEALFNLPLLKLYTASHKTPIWSLAFSQLLAIYLRRVFTAYENDSCSVPLKPNAHQKRRSAVFGGLGLPRRILE